MKTPIRLFALILLIGIGTAAHAQSLNADLHYGSRGADVTTLQQQLITAQSGASASALTSAGATGYFGALTRAALAGYQLKNGIAPAQGYFGAKTRAYLSAHPVSTTTAEVGTHFSGTLEAVDTGCFSDGVCSATVSGKKVILLTGTRVHIQVGSLKGVDSIGDLSDQIGATVNVYAASTTDSTYDYTLYGYSNYYLEVPGYGKQITAAGTIGCRPPKTTGPVITLCSFGLKTDDGTWYALSDANGMFDIASYENDQRVQVVGTTAAPPSGPFKADATIDMTGISKI